MVRGLIFGFFNLTRYKSVFAILRGGQEYLVILAPLGFFVCRLSSRVPSV